jgi:hypothetical protein
MIKMADYGGTTQLKLLVYLIYFQLRTTAKTLIIRINQQWRIMNGKWLLAFSYSYVQLIVFLLILNIQLIRKNYFLYPCTCATVVGDQRELRREARSFQDGQVR